MKAVHSWKNLSIEKEVDDSTGFLLTNKNGSYASFAFPNISRYNGFFVFEKDMFKVLESINIKDSGKIRQLSNYFSYVDADFEKARARFFMPENTGSLVIEFEDNKDIELLFDIKKSYDNSPEGREFNIEIDKDRALIRYTKRNKGIVEYEFYVALKALGSFGKLDRWINKDYPLDRKRNSSPFEWFVYDCLSLKTKKIVITACSDRKKAQRECSKIFSSAKDLFDKEKAAIERFDFPVKAPLSIGFSYLSCINSMKGLMNDGNLFAGLPWFFQYWTRDSAVSLKALIDRGEFKLVKAMIFKLFALIAKDGNMKSRIAGAGSLDSADALGWLCLRLDQFIDKLNKKGLLRKYITRAEEKALTAKVENAVSSLIKYRTKEWLAVNDSQQTWMDTKYDDDTRQGARIEIQALRLAIYRLAYKLTKKKKYKEYEQELRSLIYKKFWNLKYLDDGLDDFTVRPNIFLAAYIYPDFLMKEKWLQCFNYIIPELWLDWGGFSTIERYNKLFVSEYTGEDNRSYHRGDSWFWVNNYAAIVLRRLGYPNLIKKAEKIIEASCEEILWKGTLGCHGELSSAKELRSEGCWSQLWSNASFIEFVNEFYLGS